MSHDGTRLNPAMNWSRRALPYAVRIYALRVLDRIVVKGNTKPVSIYEILDFHDNESFPNRMTMVVHFTEDLALYREANFAGALHEFEHAFAADGQDKPSAPYRERCHSFIETPPPKGWTTEWFMA